MRVILWENVVFLVESFTSGFDLCPRSTQRSPSEKEKENHGVISIEVEGEGAHRCLFLTG